MSRRAFIALWLLLPVAVFAAPGDVLFSDDFERNAIAPWTTNNTSRSGILTGGDVSNSGTRGLFTRHNTVTVTSPSFSTAVPAAEVSAWVRRGSDAFSEYPDPGENLALEYRRSDSSWATLRTFPGGGTPGQVFVETFMLPADGLHGSFALRVRQTGGSGTSFDFYHIDDVRVTERSIPGPLVVGGCDDFSSGLSVNWTVQSSGGSAGTSAATFQSPSAALFTNGDPVTVTSNDIDTLDPAFDAVSLWIRRGADAFSENPDGNENFIVEYRNDVGVWVTLEQFAGSGTPGEIFVRSYPMGDDARHSNFALRLTQVDGSGSSFDFWHADDVCLDTRDLPALRVAKVSSTLFDPINGTANPYAIPGSVTEYLIGVSNEGAGNVDADSLVITDVVPDGVSLLVASGTGDPVQFIDGAVASGVTFDFATAVTFSEQPGGGPPFDFTPTPDADGFDGSVTGVRIALSGVMGGAGGAGNPSFQLRLLARVD
ncbi:MAG: hypothetical protein AAF004_03010 [Pseudomonadota bacterium]